MVWNKIYDFSCFLSFKKWMSLVDAPFRYWRGMRGRCRVLGDR